jgi:hypothetical protein
MLTLLLSYGERRKQGIFVAVNGNTKSKTVGFSMATSIFYALLSYGAKLGFLTSWFSNPIRIDRMAGGDTLRFRRIFAECLHRYRSGPNQATDVGICGPMNHVTGAAHLGFGWALSNVVHP